MKIQITRIYNGFIVDYGDKCIYYPTIEVTLDDLLKQHHQQIEIEKKVSGQFRSRDLSNNSSK